MDERPENNGIAGIARRRADCGSASNQRGRKRRQAAGQVRKKVTRQEKTTYIPASAF